MAKIPEVNCLKFFYFDMKLAKNYKELNCVRIKPGIYKISDSGVFTWIIDDTDSPTRVRFVNKIDILFQIFKLSEGNLPDFTLFLKIHFIQS